MTQESILEKIREIVIDYIGPDDKIVVAMESRLREDLTLDSMDILYVVFVVENTFSISVNNQQMVGLMTVADLVKVIQEKCK